MSTTTRDLFDHQHMKTYLLSSLLHLLLIIPVFESNAQVRVPGAQTGRISLVDPNGLILTNGRFGNTINGQGFQQDVLLSLKGWQYIAYYDSQRHVCVGRRKLPEGSWEIARLTDYHFSFKPGFENDAHNTISMGLCKNDGTIHLAFDHHGNSLHYRVSVKNILDNPESILWKASLFLPVRDYLEDNQPVASVTYPRFCSLPNGNMVMEYRKGGSGKGDNYIGYYDAAKGWKNVHQFISGQGIYHDLEQDSPTRNAYLNAISVDDKGKLHISWTWREGTQSGNRDICSAYSPDYGSTWFNDRNELVADALTGKVIDTFSPGVQLKQLDSSWGIMNNQAQTVDHQGILHVVMYRAKTKSPTVPAFARIANAAYYHYYRDKKGTVHEFELPAIGNRPKLLTDKDNNLYLVFLKKDALDFTEKVAGELVVMKASAHQRWTDWKMVYFSKETYFNEPMVDINRFAQDSQLAMMLQDPPKTRTTTASAVKVFEISQKLLK